MAGDDDDNWAGGDAVIGRADALLGRHKLSTQKTPPHPEAVPTLTDTVGASANAA